MINNHRVVHFGFFDLHFCLWKGGGPDFIKEFSLWEKLQDDEWHLVTKAHLSYVAAAKSKPPPSVFRGSVTPD